MGRRQKTCYKCTGSSGPDIESIAAIIPCKMRLNHLYRFGVIILWCFVSGAFSLPQTGSRPQTQGHGQTTSGVWGSNSPYASIGVPITWQQPNSEKKVGKEVWVPVQQQQNPAGLVSVWRSPGHQSTPAQTPNVVYWQSSGIDASGVKTVPSSWYFASHAPVHQVKTVPKTKTKSKGKKTPQKVKTTKTSPKRKNPLADFEIPYAPGVKLTLEKKAARKPASVQKTKVPFYHGVVQQLPQRAVVKPSKSVGKKKTGQRKVSSVRRKTQNKRVTTVQKKTKDDRYRQFALKNQHTIRKNGKSAEDKSFQKIDYLLLLF